MDSVFEQRMKITFKYFCIVYLIFSMLNLIQQEGTVA